MVKSLCTSPSPMYVLIICFVCVIFLFVVLGLLQQERFTQEYMNHKTKCFNCEQDIMARLGEDAVWFAQPAKVFDVETEGIAQAGGDMSGGFLAKTLKYY